MVVRICSDGLLNKLGVVQAMDGMLCLASLATHNSPCARWSTLARSSLILRQSIWRRTATVGSSDETLQTLSSDALIP